MSQIYVDMDGVVSDFDKAIVNIFGEEYSNKIADTFWKKTVVDNQVFRHMPPIPEGLSLVSQLRSDGHQVCFMTSTGGMPHHIDIAKQKLDWLSANSMGDLPVAFCMNTQGKGAYASPGAVLIDDRQKVLAAWRGNGGFGFQFIPEQERVLEILSYLSSL